METSSWKEPYILKEDYFVPCKCKDCKKCLPLHLCVPEDYIKYIKHYGIDVYLIRIYGNNLRAIQWMNQDEVYQAQTSFIQSEYFS
jgi:hypothetical protein